ncbi:MAG TPA: hypothetical protein VGL91_05410, partial [Acidobacteriota bacterium]
MKSRWVPTDQELCEIVNVNDAMAVVIRGHQAMQAILDSAIAAALPGPHAIELHRLSFSLKVDLAIGLQLAHQDLRLPLLAFNRLRNSFAHDPAAALTEKETAELTQAFSDRLRSFFTSMKVGTDNIEVLQGVVIMLSLELDFVLRRM